MGWRERATSVTDAPAGSWRSRAIAMTPEAPPDAGLGDAIQRGAFQGATLKFGDEITGGLGASLLKGLGALADGPMNPLQKFKQAEPGQLYQDIRDQERKADDSAHEHHPAAFTASEIAGGFAPAAVAPVLKVAQGAGLVTRALVSAANAMPIAALLGAGQSKAETLSGVAGDAWNAAKAGAGVGLALPVAGAAVKKVALPLATALKDASISLGRKALSGVGTSLSARKPIPAEAVEEAYANKSLGFGSESGGITDRLQSAADEVESRYGPIIDTLEKHGVTGPTRKPLASDIVSRATEGELNSVGSKRPGMLRDMAEEIALKATPEGTANGRLGLRQALEMTRGLQKNATREYDKISRQYTESGETKKEMASIMRQAVEDAVESQQAKAPEAAAQFQPVKAQLSRTLEALRAAEEGAARAARRKPIGLTDMLAALPAMAMGIHSHGLLGAAAGVPFALAHHIADPRLASSLGWLARQGAAGANKLASSPGFSDVLAPYAASTEGGLSPDLAALFERLRLQRGQPQPQLAEAP